MGETIERTKRKNRNNREENETRVGEDKTGLGMIEMEKA